MACCINTSVSDMGFFPSASGIDLPKYRKTHLDGKIVTIFNVDDPRSYYNWRLKLGPDKPTKRGPRPRFRELMDHEIDLPAFELTGNVDGSVHMKCPPYPSLIIDEGFPFVNLVMSDAGGYASIEIEVIDFAHKSRVIRAKNFISRTCIAQSSMDVPMRLKPSWNYVAINLKKLMRDAWNVAFKKVTSITINANARLRRIYLSDRIYMYYELPPEFRMKLTLTKETLAEIEDYLLCYPIVRPRVKKTPKPKPTLQNTNLTIPEDSTRRSMFGNLEKLRLSQTPNKGTLDEMLGKALGKVNPDWVSNVVWSYPQESGKQMRRSVLPGWTEPPGQVGEDNPLVTSAKGKVDLTKDWPKDTTKTLPELGSDKVCSFIWKSSETDGEDEYGEDEYGEDEYGEEEYGEDEYGEDEYGEGYTKAGDWAKIAENGELTPEHLAKAHKQRRGEGLYDIYNAKMINKDSQGFYGFQDTEEEIKLVYKANRRNSGVGGKPYAYATTEDEEWQTLSIKKKSSKKSEIDKDAVLDFLKISVQNPNTARKSRTSTIHTEGSLLPKKKKPIKFGRKSVQKVKTNF